MDHTVLLLDRVRHYRAEMDFSHQRMQWYPHYSLQTRKFESRKLAPLSSAMLQLAKENLARVKAERDSIVIVDTCPRIRGEQVDIFGSPIDGRSVASETAGSASSSAFSRAVDGIMADIQLPAADVSTREEIRVGQVLERLVGFELERMSEECDNILC